MRSARKNSSDTRASIIRGAGRKFREHGFEGVGVDGLAQEAGVTSGAFYGHFRSKAAVFQEALAAGLEDLRASLAALRASAGKDFAARFIELYLGERRTCSLAESCALQSLSADAARTEDDSARAAYEAGWIRARDEVAAGLSEGPMEARRERATALLALLAGGVTIARAVKRPEQSEAIVHAVRRAALQVAGESALSGGTLETEACAHDNAAEDALRAARALVRSVEDAWNARDFTRLAQAHTPDGRWRYRGEHALGREQIVSALRRQAQRAVMAWVHCELWSLAGPRLTVHVVVEWCDDSGNWFRSVGNELWQVVDFGRCIADRESALNDLPIRESERLFRWPMGPRPPDPKALTELRP